MDTFHGSYRPKDVTFLLKPLSNPSIMDVDTKEHLIQSGKKHYSEMISPESLPTPDYQSLFHAAWVTNGQRMGRDALSLAAMISKAKEGPITIVSLARAGTPIGVILKRLLEAPDLFARDDVAHYSISIIRDRGIDANALRHILRAGRSCRSIVFVDGWTGKGVITRELDASVLDFNALNHVNIDPSLWVLADLAGTASHAATMTDYLIPSSILNATVSGLVSRSILDDSIGKDDFHGCIYYRELEAHDLSLSFADHITNHARASAHRHGIPEFDQEAIDHDIKSKVRHQQVSSLLRRLMTEHGITDINLIKPGIGESTRVLLRRTPGLLILRDMAGNEVAHMRQLAHEKNVQIATTQDLGPYQAIAIIKGVADA